MHFEGVLDAKVPDLRVDPGTKSPVLQLGEIVYNVGNPSPSTAS
jgi:hypothetical protein